MNLFNIWRQNSVGTGQISQGRQKIRVVRVAKIILVLEDIDKGHVVASRKKKN